MVFIGAEECNHEKFDAVEEEEGIFSMVNVFNEFSGPNKNVKTKLIDF